MNADAYGEFVAGVLEHGYTDWTRPATYEIINEPDWRVWGDQRFADLHLSVMSNVHSAGLNTAVGGASRARTRSPVARVWKRR